VTLVWAGFLVHGTSLCSVLVVCILDLVFFYIGE